MKIYYEDSLPYAAEFFAGLGDSQVFSHKDVNAELVADADVLLVRSTTKVNAALLDANKAIKYVGTATAGTNHLDKAYLQSRGLAVQSAAGCNAVAVAEYVLSALFVMAEKLDWQLTDKTVGIVGAGHVGTRLSEKLTALGIQYYLCDPPLADAGDSRDFVTMDTIMQCDIISLHVPLIEGGKYNTEHMFDTSRIAQLREDQLLINACRGEVIDNKALLASFVAGRKLNIVLDVWENEPDIDQALVPYIALATAHIAGHTVEGKARGTEMLYQQVCEQFGFDATKKLSDYLPSPQPNCINLDETLEGQALLSALVLSVYDIRMDSAQFKNTIAQPDQFRYIRKNYSIRREFAALSVNTGNYPGSEAIYALGFNRK
ncbi:4-phosphoerythronate dehydrogenase [Paraglaciecola chathamensis]|uniref:Erythronate-4-phosphate dehydrogenase n=1 Tax=Paraglaciecola chathamensis S18K6 TaxID=1127672 RepID=A0AAV3V011_9ALTE|nr:4-phosphoerythronate dehydrogenase [Paraglaciecola chathamensis]GAC10401.1 erythronate-4-phosphate dehydrogenase [Paraglaciecola chathamensis S18K6]